MEPLGNHNLQEYLFAWMEGELDAAQSAALRQRLSDHPEDWKELDLSGRLITETRRVMLAEAPRLSPELRQRLAALAPEPSRACINTRCFRNQTDSPSAELVTEWAAAALVALVVGLIVGRVIPRNGSKPCCWPK